MSRRSRPGFTIVAVLMLAIGIGANTAIFSLLNAVLLRNLPVSRPGQLVFLGKAQAEGSTSFVPGGTVQVFSFPFFREFRREQQVFSEVGAIQSFPETTHARIAGRGEPEKIQLERVSGSYFATLAVNAFLGRLLSNADSETAGAPPVAVLRYSSWKERFGADPAIAGKTIAIGQTTYTIAGVAPPEFFGVTVGRSPDLWIPLGTPGAVRSGLIGPPPTAPKFALIPLEARTIRSWRFMAAPLSVVPLPFCLRLVYAL